MEITGEYRFAADRERVWEALNDPHMLQTCVPGCEGIEKTSDTKMQARILAVIGPVRARFDTQLKLADLQPPQSYALIGEARAGATGFGRGRADIELKKDGGETVLRYHADFKVGGELVQLGSRQVLRAMRAAADEFFGNLGRELQGGSLPSRVARAGGAVRGRSLAIAISVALLVMLLVGFLLR